MILSRQHAFLCLGTRMKFSVDVQQAIARHVGINLRGADIRVAEQFLNHAQIRAMLQQMRGKTVTQHVRRNIALHASAFHSFLNALPKRYRGKRPATTIEKHVCR